MVANKWWSHFEQSAPASAPERDRLPVEMPADVPPEVAAHARNVIASMSVGTVALPTWLQRSFFRTISDTLKNPSIATRSNKQLARQMRCDPEIEGANLHLKISIASLEWQVVPPAGETDTKIADFVAAKLAEIRQFPDLLCQLLNSVFYGPGAANLIWTRCSDGSIGIKGWLPIHSDTIQFDMHGNLGVKVGAKWLEDKGSAGTVPGFDSHVHYFDDQERFAVALMTFQRQAPDFEEPYEGAMAFGGRGLREVVWYYWLLKQTIMQNWGAYAERFAMGIRIGYFPSGNEKGRSNMEVALRNLASDVSVALPRSSPTENEYEIEMHEPSASRANTFSDLCDRLMTKCKEVIIGQTATTQAQPGAMGSKTNSEQGKTFNRQTKYVAGGLAECLNYEIVQRLVDVNFGPQKAYPVFEFSVPDPDFATWVVGVDTYIRLGGEAKDDEIRKRGGISKPREGDKKLSLETIDAMFGPDGGGAIGGTSVSTGRQGGRSKKPRASTDDSELSHFYN